MGSKFSYYCMYSHVIRASIGAVISGLLIFSATLTSSALGEDALSAEILAQMDTVDQGESRLLNAAEMVTDETVEAELNSTKEAAVAAGLNPLGVSDLLLVEYASPEVKNPGRQIVALELGEEVDALENATVDGDRTTDVIALEAGEDMDLVIEQLRAGDNTGLIERVQPIYNYRPLYAPTNDPLWSQQWYSKNQTAGLGVEGAWGNIGAEEGVTCGQSTSGRRCGGDSDVTIAVIDTGVNLNATDFTGANVNRQAAMRFYNNPDNTCAANTYYVGFQQSAGSNPPVLNFCQDIGSQFDEQGHGTGVASTIFAQDNVTGAVGVAYNTTLLPIAVHGAAFNTYFIAEAVTYAADNGADVINLSLGSPFYDSYLEDAINEVVDRGVIVVAASGNCADWTSNCDWDGNGFQTPGFFAEEDNALMYPAGFNSVLAVGASTNAQSAAAIERAYYSNFGSHIDVVAPVGDGSGSPTGNKVLCGVARSGCSNVNDYKTGFGTSYASPQIAGLAGLVKSQDPSLDTAAFRRALEANSLDLGPNGRDDEFGYGLPKANQMISSINVQITSPAISLGEVNANADVLFEASATDSSSGIARVEFYRENGTLVATDSTAPYSYTLPGSEGVHGWYGVSARAFNQEGASAESEIVYVRRMYQATPWRTDASFLTEHAMNLFEFDGTLYQTAVGFDDRIYTRNSRTPNVFNSTNSNDWTPWRTSDDPLEFTDQPIYSTVFQNRIYQVHTGGNQIVFTRSSADGINWTGWSFDPRAQQTPETRLPVDMTTFNNRLYQVMVGLDRRIYTRSSSNGVNWTAWVTGTDPLEKTDYAVHLTVFNNRLYQTHVGTNGKIFTRSSSNGTTFTAWGFGDDPLEDTNSPVTIKAFDGKLYESHRGNNALIFTRSSLDGQNWSPWMPTLNETDDEITLSVFDDHLYQGYVGRDNRLYIRRLQNP